MERRPKGAPHRDNTPIASGIKDIASSSRARDRDPLISVLISCYNGADYLPQTLDSVFRQEHDRLEVILVDDGSTDDSLIVAAEFEALQIISQHNCGVARARNRAFEESSGEYIVFLDQDDVLLPGALDLNAQILTNNPDCAMVFGRSRRISFDGSPRGVASQDVTSLRNHADSTTRDRDVDYFEVLLQGGPFCRSICPPSVAMLRREAVQTVGGFDQSVAPADDYDFYLRVAKTHGVIRHTEDLVEYRIHETNQGRVIDLMRRATLEVLHKQVEAVQGNARYEAALHVGLAEWRDYWNQRMPAYIEGLVRRGAYARSIRLASVIARENPQVLWRYVVSRLKSALG